MAAASLGGDVVEEILKEEKIFRISKHGERVQENNDKEKEDVHDEIE